MGRSELTWVSFLMSRSVYTMGEIIKTVLVDALKYINKYKHTISRERWLIKALLPMKDNRTGDLTSLRLTHHHRRCIKSIRTCWGRQHWCIWSLLHHGWGLLHRCCLLQWTQYVYCWLGLGRLWRQRAGSWSFLN